MKKIIPFFIMICCLLAVSSCSYDNFEEPKATLTGRAIYDGEAVGVRSGSSEFALFQDGYALHGSIPVYVAQDGSYSVSLFNGDYKLVRMGNAPWERPSNLYYSERKHCAGYSCDTVFLCQKRIFCQKRQQGYRTVYYQ